MTGDIHLPKLSLHLSPGHLFKLVQFSRRNAFFFPPSVFPALQSLKYSLAVPGQPLFKGGMDRVHLHSFEFAMLALT